MGDTFNSKVTVKPSDSIVAELEQSFQARGGALPPLDEQFVFCVSRGKEEECMAFAVIAPSEGIVEKYLSSTPALSNLHSQFLDCRKERTRLMEMRDKGIAVGDSAETAPASSTLRSCCSRNRNVPVHFLTENAGKIEAVSLLNRLIEADFTPGPIPNLQPLTQIRLRDFTPVDPPCRKPDN